jgi:hypothetical protein
MQGQQYYYEFCEMTSTYLKDLKANVNFRPLIYWGKKNLD